MRRFQISIQRSELCTLTDSVGEWEIPIIQLVHGAERVAIGGFTKDAAPYPSAASEYERLERRYREDPATGVYHVAAVYGPAPNGLRVLLQAIRDAATEQNVPESMAGGQDALSDELNEQIMPPTDEVDEVVPAESPEAVEVPKAVEAPKAVAKPVAAAAPKAATKQVIPKTKPTKAAVVPTPKQPTDPLPATADPLAIDE